MQSGNAVAPVAQDLGVHESVLRRWIKDFGSGPAGKASERPLKNEQSQEIERFKRELARVKVECDIIKKSARLLRERPIAKYGFIARHRTVWPVRVMYRVMTVSATGYYDWAARTPSQRSQTNTRLTTRIRESFAASDGADGSPRVWRDLQDWGEECSDNRVARLMQAAQLKARSKRRRLPGNSGQRPEHSIAPNILDRQFEAAQPNQRWVADFTYVWTAEGWLYVAVVLDLYSRRAVGWSMSSSMTAQLMIDALMMTLWKRVKSRTRDEARAHVFCYIERLYTPRRRHSTFNRLSPVEFEKHYVSLTVCP